MTLAIKNYLKKVIEFKNISIQIRINLDLQPKHNETLGAVKRQVQTWNKLKIGYKQAIKYDQAFLYTFCCVLWGTTCLQILRKHSRVCTLLTASRLLRKKYTRQLSWSMKLKSGLYSSSFHVNLSQFFLSSLFVFVINNLSKVLVESLIEKCKWSAVSFAWLTRRGWKISLNQLDLENCINC